MKELNKSEKAAIKRIAKNLYGTCYKSINKIQKKIEELQKELEIQQEIMCKMDTTPYITQSSYKAFDLVERKEQYTKDANGKEVKIVTFEFKYPEIYPEAPTNLTEEDIVGFQNFDPNDDDSFVQVEAVHEEAVSEQEEQAPVQESVVDEQQTTQEVATMEETYNPFN
jgi:MFS superfamily sulfate permease-like transporter